MCLVLVSTSGVLHDGDSLGICRSHSIGSNDLKCDLFDVCALERDLSVASGCIDMAVA